MEISRFIGVVMIFAVLAIFLGTVTPMGYASAGSIDEKTVKIFVEKRDWKQLKNMGKDVLPALVQMYENSYEADRAAIARIFYKLGWKSPEAKRVLLQDVHTDHRELRLEAQYALGRVSNDNDVVEILLDNMQNDQNPLFRDKAACALAYDQIHLTESQKVRLYEGLIHSLNDSNPQVRSIAIKALKIRTGQTKGFNPKASPETREKKISVWHQWLEEFKSNL